jgi:hypothetical protein
VILQQNNDSKRHAGAILYLSSREIPSGIMERGLRTLKGIKKVSINHLARTVWINYDPAKISSTQIREFLNKLKHQFTGTYN